MLPLFSTGYEVGLQPLSAFEGLGLDFGVTVCASLADSFENLMVYSLDVALVSVTEALSVPIVAQETSHGILTANFASGNV